MLFGAQNLHGVEEDAPVRPPLDFLVVCRDDAFFEPVAAAIHGVRGRLKCSPHAATARDYVSWRKVDGIVIDMSIPGALELIRRARGASPNRASAVFACVGSSREAQLAIGAGANYVLHRPALSARIARVFYAAADMMVADKRRHHRYPLMVQVELKMNERRVESTMSNLSEGGMAIWSLYYQSPGSDIQFAFEIPFGGLVRGHGEVAWTSPDGLAGIRFRVLTDEAKTHLSSWVARRSGES